MRRLATGAGAAALAGMLAALAAISGCTPDRELTDRQLYLKYCSKCHGEAGRGDESLRQANEKVDLLISEPIRDGDREWVARRIAYGYAQMPAYIHKLDPPDLERLVDFTMRLQDPAPAGEDGKEDDDGPATAESDLPAPRVSG